MIAHHRILPRFRRLRIPALPHSAARAGLAAALALAACSEPSSPTPKRSDAEPAPATDESGEIVAVEDGFLLSQVPDGAVGVVDAREVAEPGEPIVVRGKVGGRMDPFVENRALFVLADENAIRSCDQIPGDSCETPWDYCCEDPDLIRRSTATIQFLDADGRVADGGFKGLDGIRELSVLVVKGTVDESSSPGALVVNAEHIFVEQP